MSARGAVPKLCFHTAIIIHFLLYRRQKIDTTPIRQYSALHGHTHVGWGEGHKRDEYILKPDDLKITEEKERKKKGHKEVVVHVSEVETMTPEVAKMVWDKVTFNNTRGVWIPLRNYGDRTVFLISQCVLGQPRTSRDKHCPLLLISH